MSLNESGFERETKKTRQREFLDEMDLVLPCAEPMTLIAPHAPTPCAERGRPKSGVQTMLRIHFRQQWINLPDPMTAEALKDTPRLLEFAHRNIGAFPLPNNCAIPRSGQTPSPRLLMEARQLSCRILATVNATLTAKGLLLRERTVVDATLIAAPSSTRTSKGERDPEMHQTRKGNQWRVGMKAHGSVDADAWLFHTVTSTSANAHDITQAHALLHGEETGVFADSRYREIERREEVQAWDPDVNGHIGAMPGKVKAVKTDMPMVVIMDKLEQTKARIRAKVEHPFQVIKGQIGYVKIKCRGLARNTANLMPLFALFDNWMMRKRLIDLGAQG